MLVYLCAVIPYSIPFVTNKKLQCTLKGKEKYLLWNWNLMKYYIIMYPTFLFIICGMFIYGLTNYKIGLFFAITAIITFVSSYYIYKTKYLGTMWCYYSVFIPIILYLLQYYKFLKKI